MSGESFIEEIGKVYVSCDGDKCVVLIAFNDGTIYVTSEFNRNSDPRDLFKGRISLLPGSEPTKPS